MYFKIYDKVVLSEGAAEYLIRYKSIRNKYFFCLAYLLYSVVQICRTDRGLYIGFFCSKVKVERK